jgi:hypothetical protein
MDRETRAYAVAAANASILRAFTIMASASENSVVKAIIALSFATGFFRKYSTKIEEVGKSPESTAQIACVARRIHLSSYL